MAVAEAEGVCTGMTVEAEGMHRHGSGGGTQAGRRAVVGVRRRGREGNTWQRRGYVGGTRRGYIGGGRGGDEGL